MSTSSSAPPPHKPCIICGIDSCIIIPSIAGYNNLCLLHYYTTGAHRHSSSKQDFPNKKKKSSLFVDNKVIHDQFPDTQEIFAEAFTDLQREIREESARVYKSAANSDDPLATLLDSNASTRPGRSSFGYTTSSIARKKFRTGKETDGGFLRK